MVKKNTCVFISGEGLNLKILIYCSRDNIFPIKISLVISDNKKANGINYARKHKILNIFINTKFQNYENKILTNLRKHKISFICLAGFMKILSSKITKNYRGKIINIHPSLLPKFKGLNTFSRMLKNKEKKAGCTVHYVNEKLDSGKKNYSKKLFINDEDNEKILKVKTQKLEYRAFPEAIIKIFRKS